MKRIIKILIILIISLAAIIVYLSIYGIKTEKFNNEIIKNISKINKKINLSLNEVNYLLNPLNFSINISPHKSRYKCKSINTCGFCSGCSKTFAFI